LWVSFWFNLGFRWFMWLEEYCGGWKCQLGSGWCVGGDIGSAGGNWVKIQG
jgi:hypothetical protein